MVWSDKPTEAQIGALTREYEALLYDLLDDAKESGARDMAIALQEVLDEGTVRKAVELVPNRGDMVKAIASGGKHMYPAVADHLEKICAERGVNIKFNR